jgi:hypothetical protein
MESVSEDVGVAGRNPGDSNCSLGSSGSQPFFRLPRHARETREVPRSARGRGSAQPGMGAGEGGGGELGRGRGGST